MEGEKARSRILTLPSGCSGSWSEPAINPRGRCAARLRSLAVARSWALRSTTWSANRPVCLRIVSKPWSSSSRAWRSPTASLMAVSSEPAPARSSWRIRVSRRRRRYRYNSSDSSGVSASCRAASSANRCTSAPRRNVWVRSPAKKSAWPTCIAPTTGSLPGATDSYGGAAGCSRTAVGVTRVAASCATPSPARVLPRLDGNACIHVVEDLGVGAVVVGAVVQEVVTR